MQRIPPQPLWFWSALLGATLATVPALAQPKDSDVVYAYEQGDIAYFTDEAPEVPNYKVYRFSVRDAFREALSQLSRDEIRALIRQYSDEFGVEPALVEAIVKAESSYNPNAVSHKGARGLMQLMPATADSLGVQNIHDPKENLRGGVRYFQQLLVRYGGDIDRAVAAYNAGPKAVEKYKGVPPYAETVDYVAKVRKYYEAFRVSNVATLSK